MKQDDAIRYMLEIGEIRVDLSSGTVITSAVQQANRGYLWFNKRLNGVKYAVYVHRVIAYALWGDEILDYEVNHIDGNKKNNHPSNLELVTPSQNVRHAFATGLRKAVTWGKASGENVSTAKLTQSQVNEIRDLYASGEYTYRELGKLFGVVHTAIGKIVTYENWK